MKQKIFIRLFVPFLLAISFLSPLTVKAMEMPDVSARCAVLYDANSKVFLYEKNADEKRGMASTTKIATALVVIESGRLDEVVTITDDMIGTEGSSLYLKAGERLSVKELLYGLMLRSANDASVALATYLYGSVDAFVEEMNALCLQIGLCDTHFENPHGLDGENHYTTARELALLSAYAEENGTFREVVSTKSIRIGEGENRRLLVNHNKMLSMYDGVCGIKTGFTKKCGRTLVTSIYRGTGHLICVTLNAPDDWSDHKKLLMYGESVLGLKQE